MKLSSGAAPDHICSRFQRTIFILSAEMVSHKFLNGVSVLYAEQNKINVVPADIFAEFRLAMNFEQNGGDEVHLACLIALVSSTSSNKIPELLDLFIYQNVSDWTIRPSCHHVPMTTSLSHHKKYTPTLTNKTTNWTCWNEYKTTIKATVGKRTGSHSKNLKENCRWKLSSKCLK